MSNFKITKELIAFLAVLVAISILFGMGSLSEENFMYVLLLIIGGFVGWGIGYERGAVKTG